MLDDGVVAEPQDIDLCMLTGAGWPAHLGGITPYLDRSGVSEKVTGRRLLAPGGRLTAAGGVWSVRKFPLGHMIRSLTSAFPARHRSAECKDAGPGRWGFISLSDTCGSHSKVPGSSTLLRRR